MTERRKTNKRQWVEMGPLLALLAAAFALRVWRLDAKSLWFDEGLSLHRASSSIAYTLSGKILIPDVVTRDIQPPSYFLLLNLMLRLAGSSEFALRFPSAAANFLTVALLYIVAKRLFGPGTGLIAAALGALSPFYLWYSQEARMYSLATFWSLLSIYGLARGAFWESPADTPRTRGIWRMVCMAAALATVYTHYLAASLLAFELALLALLAWRRGQRRLLGLLLVSSLLVLPLLPHLLSRVMEQQPGRPFYVPPERALRELWTSCSLGLSVDRDRLFSFSYGFALLFIIGIVGLEKRELLQRSTKGLFLLAYFLTPATISYLALHIVSFYTSSRYFMMSSPAYYLVLAAGLESILRRSKPAFLLSSLFILRLWGLSMHNYYFEPQYVKDDNRAWSQYLAARAQPEDLIAINSPHMLHLYDYYGDPAQPHLFLPRLGQPIGLALEEVNDEIRERETVWLLRGYPFTDPEGILGSWLDKRLTKVSHTWFRAIFTALSLTRYTTQKPILEGLPPGAIGREADFAQRLTLLGYKGLSHRPKAGQVATVVLYWKAQEQPETGWAISLRLVDAQGHIWGQGDSKPFSEASMVRPWPKAYVVSTWHELPVKPATPPGSYRLEIVLYEATTLKALEVFDEKGLFRGTKLTLGEIEVGEGSPIPDLRALSIPVSARANWGREVQLLGYGLSKKALSVGDLLTLSLYYRAPRRPSRDYSLLVQVVDSRGKVWVEGAFPPAGQGHPSSRWQEGELLAGQYDLRIPATMPAGSYQVRLALREVSTGLSLPVLHLGGLVKRESIALASFQVLGREYKTEVPPIQHPLSANLGGKVEFLGYDLPVSSIKPGQTLELSLYYRALAPMETSYVAFVHLLDSKERIWGQVDSVPGNGTLPTTGWREGEVIVDKYLLSARDDAPPGEYQLEVGLYDPATLERLPIFREGKATNETRILLDKVVVH